MCSEWLRVSQTYIATPPIAQHLIRCTTVGSWVSSEGTLCLLMTQPRASGAIVTVTSMERDTYADYGVHCGSLGGLTVQGTQGFKYACVHNLKPTSITVGKGRLIGTLTEGGSTRVLLWSKRSNETLHQFCINNKPTDVQVVLDIAAQGLRLYTSRCGNVCIVLRDNGEISWSASTVEFGVCMEALGRVIRMCVNDDAYGILPATLISPD